MTKVDFSMDNIKKCICAKCPVQAKSECAKNKSEMMMKMMGSSESMKMVPKAEDVPGMYCSTGKAVCADIDTKKMCICGTCLLWGEYKLAEGKPMGYFCSDGMAE